LKPEATKSQIEAITKKVKDLGFTPHTTHGKEVTIMGVIWETPFSTRDIFERWMAWKASRRSPNL